MKAVMGKLFRCIENGRVTALEYKREQDYYSLIRDARSKGLHQCIITSDIMLTIAEQLIGEGQYIITTIDFLVEDEELQLEIFPIINELKRNPAKWIELRHKLEFLSKNDSIDIKRISFKSSDGIFFIQVNGIFSAAEQKYEQFACEISQIVEGYMQ